MTMRWGFRAGVIGIALAMVFVLAPVVLADTCCANVPVRMDPPSAMPGDTVKLTGLQCLRSDGTGPLPLNLAAFLLAPGHRPAENPGDTPGNLPYPDLPPTDTWSAFESAPPFGSATHGVATIVVPDLPDGRYQLWWLCDNGGGPGSGIHYSPGPRLAIGVPPDTATVAAASPQPGATDGSRGVPAWILAIAGAAALVISLRATSPRRR